LFALAQLVRPTIPVKPPIAEIQAPPAVRQILRRSCYSCHSDERRLAWFDEVEPAYLIARHDILGARLRLNFSSLGSAPPAVQRAKLFESVNMIQLGAMPLPQFVALHRQAKVSPEELAELKTYLAPWSGLPSDAVDPTVGPALDHISLSRVRPEPNGLALDPSFVNWKLISMTDRGDNNTFRFILGNDVAYAAEQSGNISPWPNGTRLAKIAWQQALDKDGLIHPGKFIQVEMMVKDAQRYKATDGWAWGRWRGSDLKPYGEDAHFVDECTGCHMPVRRNDYVYTLPITAAHVNREQIVNNAAASLPGNLPWQPLGWWPITMYVDPETHITATLYARDAAKQVLQVGSKPGLAYSPGSVFALVTWVQEDDPHWFGGRIPNVPQSVEFVEVPVSGGASAYRVFEGGVLAESRPTDMRAHLRASFILNLKPTTLP
jgi:hypothetical protein